MGNEDGRTFTFFGTCVRHIALLLLTLPPATVACDAQQLRQNTENRKLENPSQPPLPPLWEFLFNILF